MSKSTLTRRALVASTAAMPALAVPAAAADEDPELVALGVEFDKVAADWLRQSASDRKRAAEWRSRVEAATGIPLGESPRPFYGKPASPEEEASVDYWRIADQILDDLKPNSSRLDDQIWESIHDRMWPLAKRIVRSRPKTVAGLALVARAASFICAEWFDFNDADEQDADDRAIIEAVCSFCGVMPLSVEGDALALARVS